MFFLTDLPFPIVLLLAGLFTGGGRHAGRAAGAAAERLHLALITLMFAGAGHDRGADHQLPQRRGRLPRIYGVVVRRSATSGVRASPSGDNAYFRYTVIVAAIMFLLALVHVASKPGRAWAAIRQSEPAALAAGVNITLYKLYAFALASFMAGVAGGLLRGRRRPAQQLPVLPVKTIDSVTLLAVVLMGGIYSLWGAVIAGLLQKLLPALLNDWFAFFQQNPDFLLVLFGIGILQVLVTAPEGIVDAVPEGHAQPRPADLAHVVARRPAESAASRVIEVEGLTVRFGGVTPLDGMTVVFPRRRLRPGRPERRGQDDVLQRPQRLRQAEGGNRARLRGGPAADGRLQTGALGPAADVPAGAGDREAVGVRERGDDPRALRRRARLAPRRRHGGARPSSGSSELATQKVGVLGAGARRAVELARAVVGKPRVVLLDEPAAGLPDEQTEHLGPADQGDPRALRRARRSSSTTT